jgi:diguanylate cyclase (GGDEF)-like protein/PAS domain S-box-containing protein
MVHGKELLGFVGFDWVVEHYSYSDDEIKLLSLFSEILVNITLRKQAEIVVQESEQRLDMALTGTNAGLWDWFIQTGQTVFNERWAEIVGYTLKELEPTSIQTWKDLCHPDDLTESNNLLQSHFEGKTDYYKYEARMRHKNGDWVWVADRGKVLAWDSDGKPVRMAGTHLDITERKNAEEKIRHMATHDSLTGLPSLILTKDRIAKAMEMAKRKKNIVAILFVDLDGFKSINDNFGHDAGDFLLKEVAKRLGYCVREVDTVGRIGGDEFLLVLTELQSKENSSLIAEKIIHTIGQPVLFNGKELKVGVSIGIAISPDHSVDSEHLIKLADEAMYTIKNSCKNNFAFASS